MVLLEFIKGLKWKDLISEWQLLLLFLVLSITYYFSNEVIIGVVVSLSVQLSIIVLHLLYKEHKSRKHKKQVMINLNDKLKYITSGSSSDVEKAVTYYLLKSENGYTSEGLLKLNKIGKCGVFEEDSLLVALHRLHTRGIVTKIKDRPVWGLLYEIQSILLDNKDFLESSYNIIKNLAISPCPECGKQTCGGELCYDCIVKSLGWGIKSED